MGGRSDRAVTSDAARLLDDMLINGAADLRLAEPARSSGTQGSWPAVLVDMMTAILSGGTFGKSVKDSEATSARVCHFSVRSASTCFASG